MEIITKSESDVEKIKKGKVVSYLEVVAQQRTLQSPRN